MDQAKINRTRRRLTTPRAAAAAGIIFALLTWAAQLLIRLSIPTDSLDNGAWLASQAGSISLALSLVPFAGIAFLWFIGVIRDHLHELEDRFFATVFLGSGFLYLGMTFVAAGLAGGLLASYAADPDTLTGSDTYTFGRVVMYQISNIYGVRMAGVFMMSLGTIWVRTGAMPRWLALVTYGLALGLLLTISLSVWVTLIFPTWVFMVSLFILIQNYRRSSASSEGVPETA
ncbi:MAG TPA: hypothetical protein VEC93_08140 [Anaerolineae bacterium]|nr:hypothetical protein [Anaerolineae bacterium]